MASELLRRNAEEWCRVLTQIETEPFVRIAGIAANWGNGSGRRPVDDEHKFARLKEPYDRALVEKLEEPSPRRRRASDDKAEHVGRGATVGQRIVRGRIWWQAVRFH